MTSSDETTLVICFGIISIIATVAGLHYRDSLCCLICRSLVRAWHIDPGVDIEAIAGTLRGRHQRGGNEEDSIIELQPRRSLPLYFDSSTINSDSGQDQGIVPTTASPEAQQE